MSSKNFKYLDELIRSGAKEIVLDSDIVLDDNEESEYLEGIKLDVEDLIIDGKGYKIDAKGQSSIFKILEKNITIKNLSLKNGRFANKKGIICNEGEVTFDNCKFNYHKLNAKKLYNKIKESYLILNKGIIQFNECSFFDIVLNIESCKLIINFNELNISNCNFYDVYLKKDRCYLINNLNETNIDFSKFHNLDLKYGSRLIDNEGNLNIRKCHFHDLNIDDCFSHSLMISNYKTGLINLDSCSFDNILYYMGLMDNYGILNIYRCIFINNIKDGICANYETLGMITNWKELNIRYSNFGNISNPNGTLISCKGNTKLFECNFLKNSNVDNCDENNQNIIYVEDTLKIYNCTFDNNHAKQIIYNLGTLGVFGGKFEENNISEYVIYNARVGTFQNTAFKNNLLESQHCKNIFNKSNLTLINPIINNDGETILNEGYILIKNSQQYISNTIYGEGTVETEHDLIPKYEKFDFGYLDKKIRQSTKKEIILEEDICLEKYEIDYYEGGIELDEDNLIIDGNGKIIDANKHSRIFIVTGKNITLKNIIFKNGHCFKDYDNPTNDKGGAIRCNSYSNLTILDCVFERNGSSAIENRGHIEIRNATFTNNFTKEGGAILNDGFIRIKNTSFYRNRSRLGGAIINYGDMEIEDSVFKKNSTSTDGGAIFNEGNIKLIQCQIHKNNCGEDFPKLGFKYCAIAPPSKNIELIDCKSSRNINKEYFFWIFEILLEICFCYFFTNLLFSTTNINNFGFLGVLLIIFLDLFTMALVFLFSLPLCIGIHQKISSHFQ